MALALACTNRSSEPPPPAERDAPTAASSCPTAPIAESWAPDVGPDQRDVEHWLAKLEPGDADAVLLDADALSALREGVTALPGGWRDPLGHAVADPALIDEELSERLAFLRGRIAADKYVEIEPGTLDRAAARIEGAAAIEGPGQVQFVARETPLWCVPSTEGLFTVPVDRDFDRNRCSSLHPGELVRSLRRTSDGAWTYVDAGHSVGWIDTAERPLEPAIDVDTARERLAGPRVYLTADVDGLRHGSSFPLVSHDEDGFTITVPSPDGPIPRTLPADAPVSTQAWPLTRRQLFTQAFSLLGQPYGWGGRDGHRDCSRYLLDLFALFDVRLARNSGVQAQLGTRSVDLSKLDEAQKRAAIREAAREGVVLLYMPGHIMLYLGHERGPDLGHELGAEGELDYGISALSEYLEPCPGGPDTVHRLDKVEVTTLELGRGTERRAFIERINRMAVFGPTPG